MAFVNTVTSLNNFLKVNKQINDRLEQSIEKVSILVPTNNAVTIDPNESSLFYIGCEEDLTINITNVSEIYTHNGSSVSILLSRLNDQIVVSWDTDIKWKESVAPTLGHRDMIILTTFDNSEWLGSCIHIDNDYPTKLNPHIGLVVEDSTIGDDATIKVTLPDDATGELTITIGSEYTHTTTATGGENTITISGLSLGEKTVVVTYSGDSTYLEDSIDGQFTVENSINS